VLKTFGYENNGGEEKIDSDQISLVLGKNFVLSFLETDGTQFSSVRERLQSGKGQIRKSGADFLMYGLIDAIVDSYFVILERLDERTEALEIELIAHPQPSTLHAIYRLKREGVFLRRTLWPLREVISSLQRGDSPLFFSRNTLLYLRDVYDHTIHIIDVGGVSTRSDSGYARHLHIQRELPHQYGNESSHRYHHHIHAAGSNRRHLRHELQTYAGTGMGLGIFYGAGGNDHYQHRYAGIIPLEEMAVVE